MSFDLRSRAVAEFLGTAFLLAAIVGSGYWFTASTSFANPAVTLARSASDTFAGICPTDAPGFIVAQLTGALAATALFSWLGSGLDQPSRVNPREPGR